MACSHGSVCADAGKNLPCFQTADQTASIINHADRLIRRAATSYVDEPGVGAHTCKTGVRAGQQAAVARLLDLGGSHGA
jgi:hypothetical protein